MNSITELQTRLEKLSARVDAQFGEGTAAKITHRQATTKAVMLLADKLLEASATNAILAHVGVPSPAQAVASKIVQGEAERAVANHRPGPMLLSDYLAPSKRGLSADDRAAIEARIAAREARTPAAQAGQSRADRRKAAQAARPVGPLTAQYNAITDSCDKTLFYRENKAALDREFRQMNSDTK